MNDSADSEAFEKASVVLSERFSEIGCSDPANTPRVGIVGGSGLGGLVDAMDVQAEFSVSDLFGEAGAEAISGHALKWFVGKLGETPIHFLSGRRHLYEGASETEVVRAIRLLSAVGGKLVILTNAAGGVHPILYPGDLMLIRDQINLQFRNPLMGHNDDTMGPRFPDMSEPYSEAAGAMLRRAAIAEQVDLKEGVYCAVTGPSYETAAEVRMLRQFGAHAVGMSTVPETIAAVHAGMSVAGISVITNSHVHKPMDQETTHEEVLETSGQAQEKLIRLLRRAIPKFHMLASVRI